MQFAGTREAKLAPEWLSSIGKGALCWWTDLFIGGTIAAEI
jgi:hypothetical protein